MKIYQIFYVSLIFLILTACGLRTPPEPYPDFSITIPAMDQVSLHYRGEKLVLRWKNPMLSSKEEKIVAYNLSVLTPDLRCSHCEPILLYSKKVQEDSPLFTKSKRSEGKRQIFLENVELLESLNSPGSYTVLSFINTQGRKSSPTERLYLRKPLQIPLPEIISANSFVSSATFSVDSIEEVIKEDEEEDKKKKGEIVIQWKQIKETIQQIFEENGDITMNTRYYGVNFYRLDDEGIESLINSRPYLQGSIRLVYSSGKVIARHVDRYGNESKAVLLFIKQS